ncbi:MAG: hypothetical protein E6R13_00620 [Spirochaetes bacterium]|nr:MAG: hypothetical protein E6R13_00620 [Spirochaetota bacterium]
MNTRIKKITCRLCRGSKQSLGTGMMMGKCVECMGDGYIHDFLTDDEVLEMDKQKKLEELRDKKQKRENIIISVATKLTYKDPNISFEEAKKIASEELDRQDLQEEQETQEDKKEVVSNVEKSRKPRKKKEELSDSLENSQPEIIPESTVSDNLLD